MTMRDRRTVLRGILGSLVGLSAAACDKFNSEQSTQDVLDRAESLTELTQRALAGHALAPEFPESAIAPSFRGNGTTDPDSDEYKAMAAENFANWKLEVSGLVAKPIQLSLADLRAMPSRTQITRHDCVEGWSAIAKWKGVPLSAVLSAAGGLQSTARYLMFYCADSLEASLDGSGDYYESIAVIDAYHPQTILAYDMNDAALPITNGAPLRLRIERMLGYKMAKYVMRIEAVDDFSTIQQGKGGYWEDRGYQWYAGI